MSGPTALKSLDKLQLGHIRHFNNLSRQLPNQWELMKGKGYGQEDFGGFRFSTGLYGLRPRADPQTSPARGARSVQADLRATDRKDAFTGSVDILARCQPRRKHL